MQGPTIPGGIETDHPLRRSFADNYGIDSPFPDEMVRPDRSLRPHWREFVSLLDELIALQKMCEPLELCFTNAEKTTAVLNLVRRGELFIVVGKSEEDGSTDAGMSVLVARSGETSTQ